MVQGQWVLLTFLTACSVETLNIHVPKRGVESINQEDLRRAVWKLESVESPTDWWENRAKQLEISSVGTTPYCYSHSNEHDTGIRLYIEDHTPLSFAILASWAKAVHRVDREFGWQFCIQKPQEDPEWKNIAMQSWFSYEDQPFTEVRFDLLEEQLRQKVEYYWDPR